MYQRSQTAQFSKNPAFFHSSNDRLITIGNFLRPYLTPIMPSYSSSSSRHSHSSSSRKNDVYIGGDGNGSSSSRRSKYVQDKKWYCAWCNFGPLDWTYDTSCVECGRQRDQYCHIEYKTRKVRVT